MFGRVSWQNSLSRSFCNNTTGENDLTGVWRCLRLRLPWHQCIEGVHRHSYVHRAALLVFHELFCSDPVGNRQCYCNNSKLVCKIERVLSLVVYSPSPGEAYGRHRGMHEEETQEHEVENQNYAHKDSLRPTGMHNCGWCSGV